MMMIVVTVIAIVAKKITVSFVELAVSVLILRSQHIMKTTNKQTKNVKRETHTKRKENN
jgi:hypothetical protein